MTFVDFTAFSAQICSHNLWKFVNYLFINEANVVVLRGEMGIFNLIDCDLNCVRLCADGFIDFIASSMK